MDMGKGQLGFMILWFGFYYGEQIIFYSLRVKNEFQYPRQDTSE